MFFKKSALILARCALFCSIMSVNSVCGIPYFEPKQPEELERLKINRCL